MTNPNPTVPLILSLVACFLFAIAIIAGYFHGNMHLFKNTKECTHPMNTDFNLSLEDYTIIINTTLLQEGREMPPHIQCL